MELQGDYTALASYRAVVPDGGHKTPVGLVSELFDQASGQVIKIEDLGVLGLSHLGHAFMSGPHRKLFKPCMGSNV